MRKTLSCLAPFLLAGFACTPGTKSDDNGSSGDGDTSMGDGDGDSGSGGASSGSGGSGPGAGGGTATGGSNPGTGGTDGGPEGVCPAGSDALTLDLNGITLEPVPGVTNHHNGWGNIEGPVWIGDALYYSNIGGGNNPPPSVIWKLVPGSTPEVVVMDSGSNGLATDGIRLYAAMHSDGTISTRELASLGTATAVVGTYDEGKRFNSPNDLVLVSDGSLYFTDPTWQAPSPPPQEAARAYHVKDGVATALATTSAPNNPNGITLSLDESTLYIGGENGLFRYTLNSDGTVESPGTQISTANLPMGSGIDGLGRDCAGNIYVTVHSAKDVVVLDSSGAEIGKLDVDSDGGVTNVAFGGANRTTLYVTSLGSTPMIHSAELNVPGYPY